MHLAPAPALATLALPLLAGALHRLVTSNAAIQVSGCHIKFVPWHIVIKNSMAVIYECLY